MSPFLRASLIILGLLILCGSLALIVYLNLPVDSQSVQATLEPTLFISP